MNIWKPLRYVPTKSFSTKRALRNTTGITKPDASNDTISATVLNLSREVRVEELLKRPLRTTHKKILYPTDFTSLDPIFDHYPESTNADQSQHSQLSELPPDTTGEGQGEDETEVLAKATGLTSREIKSLIQRPLVTRRVVNQTRKGKQASMYTLAVVGNGAGMIGYGEGKHAEQATATRKAITQAVKNMEYVPRYQNRTIYGEFDYKFHAVQLKLRSRPAGFGLRANHFIYEICRCAGITDISAKVWGSRTGMNVVKATFEALKAQKLPQTIAKERGRKIVDLEQTYYGR
ncbi:protein of unknown function [Taphrina deformans PYCC 5710]|uniref:Small ribosomal subunit protein uS5m n=1 Tax=Taphrina deformans (strain PYCC 5710 / ATCC 11124 / CBS 356.35 / IMI 108563 / JCM 9778 / NBRC 8474) TaxID=1097556 RepID=R4XD98_TAPDE|nr:protein of unknown function [Taphrina deformans PYCC 5710]|eukprot:CCG83856.1 protein of unknown function [Taphrina deformans PYCC 5710]